MVFKTFPSDPNLYSEDLRPIVSETIARYGEDEWKAALLTTLIHGHLGIYAIIGVKMGIKALEYLGEEAGNVKVLSYAGLMPPVSCMNDGLQVSTEATLGHGLIDSPQTDSPLTEAVFSSKEKSIHIRLKSDVTMMINKEIAGAVKQYGHSPDYWNYVRNLAINCWRNLDRQNIFEII